MKKKTLSFEHNLWESLHDLGGDAGLEVLHGPDKLGQHLDENARPGALRGSIGHRAVLQQAWIGIQLGRRLAQKQICRRLLKFEHVWTPICEDLRPS